MPPTNTLGSRIAQSKAAFYATRYASLLLPRTLLRPPKPPPLTPAEQEDLQRRLAYYLGNPASWILSDIDQWTTIQDLSRERHNVYFLDLYPFARLHPSHLKLLYRFGDVTDCQPRPTLVKSRPIGTCTASVLFRLNTVRHFRFVDDPTPFEAKKPLLVWRGGAYQENRRRFLREFSRHPMCDVGHVVRKNPSGICDKPFMPITRQLDYRFVLSLEGNDVATNLKWILSSNSLCFMPKPRFETWFMEGTLVPGTHYVAIRDDYADLPEKLTHYNSHLEDAHAILRNAQAYAARFNHPARERYLSHLLLQAYFHHTGQHS